MKTLFNRFLLKTTDHPVWVMFSLLLITTFAVIGYIDPEIITGSEEVAFAQDSRPRDPSRDDPEPLPPVSPIRLTGADIVLIIDSEQFFTPKGSDAIRDIVASLEELSIVEDVFWMDDAPPLNLFSLRNPVFPKGTASQRQFDLAKEKALANPLLRGQMLSDDAQTLMLMVSLDWLFVESDEQCTELIRETVQQSIDEFPDVEMSFLVSGSVPGYLTFVASRSRNQMRYQVIGYGMILLMAVILFRGVRAVMIVALAPAIGVFWTLGYLRYFDLQDNPFNDIVLPVLISLVAFTDGVHLMVEIRRRRSEGESGRDAARNALEKVGLACFLTSLTTAIGLGALSLAHHEVVQEFGWSCVIGVILSFLAVILVIPFLCRTRVGNRIHIGHGTGLVDRSLGRIGGIIDKVMLRPREMSILAIVCTLTLVGCSLQLSPDERVANALPPDSEVARAIAHLDQKMHGMEASRIDINWSEQIQSDAEEVLEVIGAVQDILEREELIGHPISLKSLVDALPGDPNSPGRMSMTELLPPPLKRAFFTPERRSATVAFRVQDLGIAAYGPVFTRIQEELKTLGQAHPEFALDLTGRAVWRWRDLYQIVVDLAFSLGSASVVIFFVLTLAYKSIRIGLIALIPNFFPLAFTGTWLFLTGHNLELSMVCAFTVCMGIAVDDTIHFLTRYQEESHDKSEEDAIRSAFISTGTALVMTTVILTLGFSTVMFSGMREQRIFATMACLTIGSALVGDLLFLPPMLAYFRKRKRGS